MPFNHYRPPEALMMGEGNKNNPQNSKGFV
jgi:hypothetical protein